MHKCRYGHQLSLHDQVACEIAVFAFHNSDE